VTRGQPKGDRVGGLGIDPGVKDWYKDRKQLRDRARVRVKYDLPPSLKKAIEDEAAGWETSASQFAAFLLAWAMHEYHAKNEGLRQAIRKAQTPAKALRFVNDLEIPDEWGKVPA